MSQRDFFSAKPEKLRPVEDLKKTLMPHLERVGNDFRQTGCHSQMLLYLDHLRTETRMTEEFLKTDGHISKNQ